jgi:hypothetical protein
MSIASAGSRFRTSEPVTTLPHIALKRGPRIDAAAHPAARLPSATILSFMFNQGD